MTPKLQIAPSLLSADFGRLKDEIEDVAQGGADMIHVDVMDGRFVPNITLGPLVLSAARRATSLPMDVHLMIETPERHIESFAEAGADIITVQYEACTHLQRCLAQIRKLGKRAGVALNPHTPESSLEYLWGDLDVVLIMSVNPGFGGQSFLPSQLQKIERCRERIETLGLKVDLEVDGGVNTATLGQVVGAGANIVVAGSAVFGQKNRADAIAALRACATT